MPFPIFHLLSCFKRSRFQLLCFLRLVRFVFLISIRIVLFYTSFLVFLTVKFSFEFLSVLLLLSVISYFTLVMESHRCPHEVTSLGSPKPVQGIPLQGPFDLGTLSIECFHYQEARDYYYTSF